MSIQPTTRLPRRTWFWLLGPPAVVVSGLLIGRNVFAVFAAYQLGFCLLLPAVQNLGRRRLSLADHLEFLGLTGRGAGRGLLVGLVFAVVLGGGTILTFRLWEDLFLAGHGIPEILERWGVEEGNRAWVFWFMTLVNGPAEELYWRGFVQGEMAGRGPRAGIILLTAAGYASYHGVTVLLLLGSLPVAALFLAGIFVAGAGWGWLRDRTGSVWPALLGHAGAAAAYMVVARPLMGL